MSFGFNKDAKIKQALVNKGGIMFFTVERPECIYSGMVILSPVKDNRQRRAVYIKKYDLDAESGCNRGG
ncbi:MAG: hypothetical protein ABIH18_05025 [Candidatus Omnitrophota bacterium]